MPSRPSTPSCDTHLPRPHRRGTGGGTTELARTGGMYVNRWGIPGLNNNGSMFIPPGEGCYLGSLYIDGSAGQVTCHVAYGQSRKWGVWNACNRKPLYLKAGDSTASWTYNLGTVRASNNDSDNSLTVFSGLAEERFSISFAQKIQAVSTDSVEARNGIGWNSTTAATGMRGTMGSGDGTDAEVSNGNALSTALVAAALGINVVTALEGMADVASTSTTWYGTETNMLLSAHWRG